LAAGLCSDPLGGHTDHIAGFRLTAGAPGKRGEWGKERGRKEGRGRVQAEEGGKGREKWRSFAPQQFSKVSAYIPITCS